MTSETELKPCPFCGCDATTVYAKRGWKGECSNRFGTCTVNARTHYQPTKPQAIDAWNRRASEPLHPDDAAVDRFASAMKAKLAQKRAEGRGGWDGPTCNAEFLSRLLREHVEKGDPLDVGNLAMMLHQRGERIAAALARHTKGDRDDG